MAEEKRQPWMKWYPADWRADPGLHMCGFAARGLWADMLALMHEATPYGHLVVNGRAPTPRQIAQLLGGGSAKEVEALLSELREAGVFSENDIGIYSRRMVRDRAKAEEDRANGRAGGNPRLKGENNPPVGNGVNPQPNPSVNGGDKAQMLEARSQRLEGEIERPIAGATRPLPSDWKPGPESEQFCTLRAISAEVQRAELDRFVMHYRANGERRSNWDAAWCKWLISRGQFEPRDQPARPKKQAAYVP